MIIIYLKYKRIIDIIGPILLSVLCTVIMTQNIEPIVVYCDDRTLYDQMNEPVPPHYSTKIYYADGSTRTYYPDGTVKNKLAGSTEIRVIEINPSRNNEEYTPTRICTREEWDALYNKVSKTPATAIDPVIDGNDTAENTYQNIQAANNTLSETQILNNLVEILKQCTTKNQISTASINFAAMNVPFHLWAITGEQLQDTNSAINQYMDTFLDKILVTSSEQRMAHLHYLAGIATYNAGVLFNALDKPEILDTVFYNSLEKLARTV